MLSDRLCCLYYVHSEQVYENLYERLRRESSIFSRVVNGVVV